MKGLNAQKIASVYDISKMLDHQKWYLICIILTGILDIYVNAICLCSLLSMLENKNQIRGQFSSFAYEWHTYEQA